MHEHLSTRPATVDPFARPLSDQRREYAIWVERQRSVRSALARRRAVRMERAAARCALRLRRAAERSVRRAVAAELRAQHLARV